MVETDTAHGGHPRYRGVGGMAGIAKHLARRLDVRTGVTVERVERDGPAGGWRVWTDDGRSMAADALVMTAPAPQSLVLLNAGGVELAPAVRDGLAAVVYDPCFAVLAELAGPSGLAGAAGSAGGLFVDPDSTAGAVISWMADNTAKGVAEPADGRACVTIHATGEFSRRRFDDAKDDVAADILAAAAPLLGSAVASHSIHRWKFAQPTVFHPEACGFDDSTGAPVAFAGDGFLSAKVEGAALSGMAAAGRLLAIPLMAVPT